MPYCPSIKTLFATLLMSEPLFFHGALNISTAVAAEPELKVVQLLKTTHSWDGTPYKSYPDAQPEISVLYYKIPPHSTLPWHSHPVINAGYVLSGHLKVIRKHDGKSMMIGPGDVLPEMVEAPHCGESGDEPVELIVFYAGTPGVPLVVRSDHE
ncbi:cupin domain-containing protein [Pseudomonas matsuisoli]|uniref:Cupin type-2 domain-containing protein n=1 Tax=Pseudomonas matsuisoli TaxID=1515666 RepID=A0A917Q2T1_9PSED|nr:cupin domain-containing protein [Pseudomonas matsuisoli]GGK08732.1 hypothetical protein GCM10009304_38520 [Pseudomonas matsuisoli]